MSPTAPPAALAAAEPPAPPAGAGETPDLSSLAGLPIGRRRFERGALLAAAGSPAEAVYLIAAGQVRAFLLHESGRETTTAVLGRGQVAGLAPLLGRPVYHGFVEALTTVEAWALPACRLREQLAQHPALRAIVLASLARRLMLAEALVRDVALLPVPERLPDVLERLTALLDGERPQLTHDLLGALVGASRESVSRAVGRAQTEGAERPPAVAPAAAPVTPGAPDPPGAAPRGVLVRTYARRRRAPAA